MTDVVRIPQTSLMQYGVLAMPLAFAGMPLYIHAPDFYAAHYGAPLATIGVILLGLRCFDALQDTIIGQLSDRFSDKRGSVILIAAILLVASFYALFSPNKDSLLLWFTVSMLLATTAYSIISINLNTLGGLWSDAIHEKTRITTTREAFGLIGLLLAVILPATLMQSMPATQAFHWVASALSILMIVAVLIFIRWYRSIPIAQDQKVAQRISLIQTIKNLSAPTKRFFVIYGISMFASGLPALLVLFFIRDRLGAEEDTAYFYYYIFWPRLLVCFCGSGLVKAKGKINTWMIAMLLAVVSFVWAFFLGEGDVWQYAVICAFSGIAFGADLALPPSILADLIQKSDSKRHAAMQFGVLAFLAKFALALASFIGLSLLDIAGFKPASDNSRDALLMLSALYALIPCIIKLLSVFLLYCSHTIFDGGNHEIVHNHSSNRERHHA